MRRVILLTALFIGLCSAGCGKQELEEPPAGTRNVQTADSAMACRPASKRKVTADDIKITKELLFDRYTPEKDVYPYGDTVRSFKWKTIRQCLAFIENMQQEKVHWAVFRNYKNQNGEAPVVRRFVRNAYRVPRHTCFTRSIRRTVCRGRHIFYDRICQVAVCAYHL